MTSLDIEQPDSGRRSFCRSLISAAGLAGAAVFMPSLAQAGSMAVPGTGDFRVHFYNQHTGERFNDVYRTGHRYNAAAFEEINRILRDFRTEEVFPIDPRAIDILYMIQKKSGTRGAIEILSGYRSPKTNAMLARNSGGVANNSLHMTGQALDMRVPGYSTRRVRDIAVGLRAGGVGYYSRSNFVHVDTGQIRRW